MIFLDLESYSSSCEITSRWFLNSQSLRLFQSWSTHMKRYVYMKGNINRKKLECFLKFVMMNADI